MELPGAIDQETFRLQTTEGGRIAVDLNDILRSGNKPEESRVRSVPVDKDLTKKKTVLLPKPESVPPLNFSLVEDKIYRSGFPMPKNYPFLEHLGLQTIIYLGDLGMSSKKEKGDGESKSEKKKDKHGTAEIMENYEKWISSTSINFHKLHMESSQEPFNSPTKSKQAQESLTKALQLMLDKKNFPMLIHSNKGKHRIGVLVGVLRKILQGWCMSGIFEEYEKFSMGKSEFDLEFIELCEPELWYTEESKPQFVRI